MQASVVFVAQAIFPGSQLLREISKMHLIMLSPMMNKTEKSPVFGNTWKERNIKSVPDYSIRTIH